MALVPCKNCGKMISSYSTKCPACGHVISTAAPRPVPTGQPITYDGKAHHYDDNKAAKRKKLITLGAIAAGCILLGALAWSFLRSDSPTDNTGTIASEKQSGPSSELSAGYLSPDLAFFDLQGKVKSMKITFRSGQSETFNFDEKGNCLNINNNWVDGTQTVEVKRNADGFITSAKWDMGDKVPAFERSIWVNGRISERRYEDWEYSAKDRLEYASNGRLIKQVTERVTAGKTGRETDTYQYISFDDQGNWTDREVTHAVDNAKGEVAHEKREITYYQ